MHYTLWSRGRLLGHTDLDIPCVQSSIRQGFIEPTEIGRRLLPDATGVPRACAAIHRAAQRAGKRSDEADLTEFMKACARREALALELRDESGQRFEYEWLRVYDHQDRSGDDLDYDDEPLSPEAEAAIAEDVAAIMESLEEDLYASLWPPPDPRWDTTQYHVMVHLQREDVEIGGLF